MDCTKNLTSLQEPTMLHSGRCIVLFLQNIVCIIFFLIVISCCWFCPLLQALIFSDARGIKENSVKLGAGEDLYALFAGVLTMRPWNRVIDQSVDHLALQGDDTDHSELQVSIYNKCIIC